MMNTKASSRLWISVFCCLLLILAGCSTVQSVSSGVRSLSHRLVFRGASMEPAIKDGQTITYESVSIPDLQRGDILVIQKDGSSMVKRLIGLPGETIEIRGGVVYNNDQALAESYILEPMSESSAKTTLAADEYFLMGDNRKNSTDSRSFGPVKADDIQGRVVLKP